MKYVIIDSTILFTPQRCKSAIENEGIVLAACNKRNGYWINFRNKFVDECNNRAGFVACNNRARTLGMILAKRV